MPFLLQAEGRGVCLFRFGPDEAEGLKEALNPMRVRPHSPQMRVGPHSWRWIPTDEGASPQMRVRPHI